MYKLQAILFDFELKKKEVKVRNKKSDPGEENKTRYL